MKVPGWVPFGDARAKNRVLDGPLYEGARVRETATRNSA